ncbi:MAG: cupin domain-containing protein [Anaeroplasma sp.]
MKLGIKIKEKRKLLCLTQEELANRCELSKGFISQVENDKVSPSIETLELILEVLGTTLSDFFKETDTPNIIFTQEEQYEKDFGSYNQVWLVPTAQEHIMEPIYITLMPNSETVLDYPHYGEEFGYVIDGEIIVCYGDKEEKCKTGESFYFIANKEHNIKNKTNKVAQIIWVSSPPNF